MKVLTFRELFMGAMKIQKENNLTENELGDLRIVLGDDEELNGVHEAYFIQAVDTTKAKGYTWKDMESGKITFQKYTAQSLEQDIKDQTKINGLCILIS
jgi:hypothetical protein